MIKPYHTKPHHPVPPQKPNSAPPKKMPTGALL